MLCDVTHSRTLGRIILCMASSQKLWHRKKLLHLQYHQKALHFFSKISRVQETITKGIILLNLYFLNGLLKVETSELSSYDGICLNPSVKSTTQNIFYLLTFYYIIRTRNLIVFSFNYFIKIFYTTSKIPIKFFNNNQTLKSVSWFAYFRRISFFF